MNKANVEALELDIAKLAKPYLNSETDLSHGYLRAVSDFYELLRQHTEIDTKGNVAGEPGRSWYGGFDSRTAASEYGNET